MVFSSLVFLCVFLPVIFCIYYMVPWLKVRNLILIVFSLLFYAYGEPVYIILMLASTVFNYCFGLLMAQGKRKERNVTGILVLAIVVNVGLLGVFKYADMFLETVGFLFRQPVQTVGLRLPIGISFYTFQAMSYLIDVYRDKVTAQKNYLKVLLYISFFPQLIAGPIVKYHDIEVQIDNRKASLEEIAKGFRRFVIGLSKKVLISNVVAMAADNIFSLELQNVNGLSAWIGAIAYMLQIYYDFSGYSDMAIGLGHMFGFTFMENFQYPYSAVSIQDFWRKWHISLSTWFKEYLYIPLGGNRKGRIRTWCNRMFVFFCTGLWHGANWTFVLWGLFHGMLLVFEDILKGRKTHPKLPLFVKRLYTLLMVCVGFVMFRSDSVAQGFSMIGKMFVGWNMDRQLINLALIPCNPLFLVCVVIGIVGQFPWLPAVTKKLCSNSKMESIMESASYVVSVLLLVLCLMNLSGGTYNPFIYFRF